METIDVTGLPEPVVKAIEAMVESLRRQDSDRKDPTMRPRELPIKPGAVIEPLTRETIYDDGR